MNDFKTMKDFPSIHECMGAWTDDGIYMAFPDEHIVRCGDCRYAHELVDAYRGGLLCCLDMRHKVKPEDFCSRGEKKEDCTDDSTD